MEKNKKTYFSFHVDEELGRKLRLVILLSRKDHQRFFTDEMQTVIDKYEQRNPAFMEQLYNFMFKPVLSNDEGDES